MGGAYIYIYIYMHVQLDARATRGQPHPDRLAGGRTRVDRVRACLSPLGHLAKGNRQYTTPMAMHYTTTSYLLATATTST